MHSKNSGLVWYKGGCSGLLRTIVITCTCTIMSLQCNYIRLWWTSCVHACYCIL